MDLARWWADRRWRGLLELIDQLPTASRLNEAIWNDPERAELMARARIEQEGNDDDEDAEPWSPRMAEFDLHAQLLRDVIQAVMQLEHTTILAAGPKKKPKAPKPYPHPVTEVDRAVERINRAWAQSIIDLFTPGRG